MRDGHLEASGASIKHGDATALFPISELDATVNQYRDAALALTDTNRADIIAITPTSMASSYFLTQHPLTASVFS